MAGAYYAKASGAWKYANQRDGKRIVIHLGTKITETEAREYGELIDAAVESLRRTGRVSAAVADGLRTLPPKVRESVQKQGLFEIPPPRSMEAVALFERYEGAYPKNQAWRRYKDAKRYFFEYFDGNAMISALDRTAVAAFGEWLLEGRSRKLAPTTACLIWRVYRAIWRYGQEIGAVSISHFQRVKCGSEQGRPSVYVDRTKIHRLMEACDDAEIRLVLAFARFAGLRIPSEIVDLTWASVRGNLLQIPDGKTGWRTVPVSHELRDEIERYAAALRRGKRQPKRNDYLFPGVRRRRSDSHCCNAVRRLMRRVLPPGECWTKIMNSLRASCITDYVAEGIPDKTLDLMFGNSAKIRSKYYVKFRKSDYDRVLAVRFDGEGDERTELLKRLFPLVAENDAAGRLFGDLLAALGLSPDRLR